MRFILYLISAVPTISLVIFLLPKVNYHTEQSLPQVHHAPGVHQDRRRAHRHGKFPVLCGTFSILLQLCGEKFPVLPKRILLGCFRYL
jgi:hypothetical protein